MIAEIKFGLILGMTAFLAMCATITKQPTRPVHRHSSKKAHTKVVHEYYPPKPPEVIIVPIPSIPPSTPPPTPHPISTPTQTPWYKTTTHRSPPWSPNYRPNE